MVLSELLRSFLCLSKPFSCFSSKKEISRAADSDTLLFSEVITAKEYDTIKLTALFAARYGDMFIQELKKRSDPQLDFDFLESSTDDEKFIVFCWLRGKFSNAIKPDYKLKRPSLEPVVEDFIQLVQEEGGFVNGIDYFAGIRMVQPPIYTSFSDDEAINAKAAAQENRFF